MGINTRIGLFLTMAVMMSACSTNKEQEALAKAQKCLDELSTANAASGAAACFSLVSEYTSSAANKMKCAIRLTEGGVNESKVTQAFDILQTPGANKEAEFMSLLSLSDVSAAGMTKAKNAQEFCKGSGDPGFTYIASLVVAGTALSVAQEAIKVKVGGDPNATVATVLNNCTASGTLSTECQSLVTDLSPVASTMADAYCGQATADEQVCGVVNEAIAATANDPALLGAALLCYMKQGSTSFSGGTCQ